MMNRRSFLQQGGGALASARLMGAAGMPGMALAGEAPAKRVLFLSRLGRAGFDRLQAAVPSVTLVYGERDKLKEQLADVDGVIGRINPELALSSPRLKWVQTENAGVEQFTFSPDFVKSQITLSNCKIIQGPEIADHAMGLLLALTRRLIFAMRNDLQETWAKPDIPPIELRGKTAVVIGVGGIGTQIALRAHASGMSVIGVDPKDIPYSYYLAKVVPPDLRDTVLPDADVVFVSTPLTPMSQGMMGAKEFGLMKQNSYFIAVSRGRLYDMNALVGVLESKKLAGAGVDVTSPEPLPNGHPLWKFPNVVITCHYAGASDGELLRDEKLFAENLGRFAAGEPLLNVVDKEKGY
jgi:phosphoglycerate dehydrogenase-like enzyme